MAIHDTIIVGSSCGGFDFYAKKQGDDQFVWLGANENSDIDVYSDGPVKIEGARIDRKYLRYFEKSWTGENNFWLGYKLPYLANGKLHVPEDKTYLCWSIGKKLQLKVAEKLRMAGTLFDIYNPEKNYLFTIPFVPISPTIYRRKQIREAMEKNMCIRNKDSVV